MSAMKRYPNWLEMPNEVMVNIFQRLRIIELFKTAPKVCKTWRGICRDPAMWKVINMFKPADAWNTSYIRYKFEMLMKQAVDLSCGELMDLSIKYFVTDDLLHHVVLHSNKLKRLCIVSCYNITGSGLSRAVKNLPELEILRLYYTSISDKDIFVIGKICPQLKSFKMRKAVRVLAVTCDDYAYAIASSMPQLIQLELSNCTITNDGLEIIVKGCPHLQSLDVHMCPNLDLYRNRGKLCMELIK